MARSARILKIGQESNETLSIRPRAVTRSGASTAMHCAAAPPMSWPISTTFPIPSASSSCGCSRACAAIDTSRSAGFADSPKPIRSGAITSKSLDSSAPTASHSREEVGMPCSRSTCGPPPARRTAISTPSTVTCSVGAKGGIRVTVRERRPVRDVSL